MALFQKTFSNQSSLKADTGNITSSLIVNNVAVSGLTQNNTPIIDYSYDVNTLSGRVFLNSLNIINNNTYTNQIRNIANANTTYINTLSGNIFTQGKTISNNTSFINTLSGRIYNLSQNSSSGGLIKYTTIYENTFADGTYDGVIDIYTTTYNTSGGALLFLGNFTAYSIIDNNACYFFVIINGSIAHRIMLYVRYAFDTHEYPISFYATYPAGTLSIALRLGGNTRIDGNSSISLTVQEVISGTNGGVVITGPQGATGATGPTGPTGATGSVSNTVYGDFTVSGGGVTATYFNATSDYRIKTDVIDLKNIYVDNLRPVIYKNTITNKNDIGLIAHEVKQEIPWLVDGEKDDEKLQSLNYIGLIPILIKEIQDMKKRIKVLEMKIKMSV